MVLKEECSNCLHYKELPSGQIIYKQPDGTKTRGNAMKGSYGEAWCDHKGEYVPKDFHCDAWELKP